MHKQSTKLRVSLPAMWCIGHAEIVVSQKPGRLHAPQCRIQQRSPGTCSSRPKGELSVHAPRWLNPQHYTNKLELKSKWVKFSCNRILRLYGWSRKHTILNCFLAKRSRYHILLVDFECRTLLCSSIHTELIYNKNNSANRKKMASA